MFVQIVLFTKDEMVVYFLYEDQNKYYDADGIPSTYTHHKVYKPLGIGFSEGPPKIFTNA